MKVKMMANMVAPMRAHAGAFWVFLAVAAFSLSSTVHAGTLDDVKARGTLNCGVSEGLLGFSAKDAKGKWQGFDVDFCRAVAAAVLGSADKVKYTSLTADKRFAALAKGEIDLLSRNTTWTMARDVDMAFGFSGVIYYDGQGFMVRRIDGLSSALQLQGARVCVLRGTTHKVNAADYFARNKIKAALLNFNSRAELLTAYASGKCDAYSADSSALASERIKLDDRDEHMILPEIISKEPLSPVVRQADPIWADIVRWTLFLLINAEESGVTSAIATSGNLKGLGGDAAGKLGLAQNWKNVVLTSVGNYAEIFERNIGRDTKLEIDRGLNALWNKGGILYAPPMR